MQNNPQTPDVRGIRIAMFVNFRWHVSGGSTRRVCHVLGFFVIQWDTLIRFCVSPSAKGLPGFVFWGPSKDARDAKVGDTQTARLVDKDIVRFDVAVDYAV